MAEEERWDAITVEQYWRERGEDPRERRPTPWWSIQNQKPPDPPRRIVKRSPSKHSEPRRRLVRIKERETPEG